MSENSQILVSVGIDPGPASGHICFIGPHETVIKPTPAGTAEMCGLFDWTGQVMYYIVLERQQTFGIEARGRLSKLLIEYGQWQGMLAALQYQGLAVACTISPKEWQWVYERLLPEPPKEPKRGGYNSESAYKRARTIYRRERERVKTRRKTVLHRCAKDKAPPGVKILKPAADSYLLALHAGKVLLRECGVARLGAEDQ